MPSVIHWSATLQERQVIGALNFLRLLLSEKEVKKAGKQLRRKFTITFHAAKDIIRASQSQMVADSDDNLKEQLRKIKVGESISPIVLLRLERRVIVADGFHRLCAGYKIDEKQKIACIEIEL